MTALCWRRRLHGGRRLKASGEGARGEMRLGAACYGDSAVAGRGDSFGGAARTCIRSLLRSLHRTLERHPDEPLIGDTGVLRATAHRLEQLLGQAKIHGLVFALHLEPHD